MLPTWLQRLRREVKLSSRSPPWGSTTIGTILLLLLLLTVGLLYGTTEVIREVLVHEVLFFFVHLVVC